MWVKCYKYMFELDLLSVITDNLRGRIIANNFLILQQHLTYYHDRCLFDSHRLSNWLPWAFFPNDMRSSVKTKGNLLDNNLAVMKTKATQKIKGHSFSMVVFIAGIEMSPLVKILMSWKEFPESTKNWLFWGRYYYNHEVDSYSKKSLEEKTSF